MNVTTAVLLAGLLAASAGSRGAEPAAPPDRLSDLLAEADARAPMLLAARAEAAAAAARSWGASSPGEVMVEGARKEDPGMRSSMLGLRLSLPFPGTSIFAGRSAHLAARAAAERARGVALETAARVRTAYYRLARAEGTLRAVEQARDLYRQAAAVAKSRSVNPMRGRTVQAPAGGGMGGGAPMGGNATADFLLLEAASARMDVMVIMQASERTMAEAELAELLGRPREAGRLSGAVLPDLPEPALQADRLAARATERSPDILAARHEAGAASAEAGRMGMMTLPMVSPFYTLERFEMGGSGTLIGLALSYPLWFWKPAADWREAAAMRDAKRADAAAREAMVVRMVREEVAETRARWEAAVRYRDAIIPLLEQSQRAARAAYEAGAADVQGVYTTTREWLTANTEFYDQAYHFGAHWAALERVVGEPTRGGDTP